MSSGFPRLGGTLHIAPGEPLVWIRGNGSHQSLTATLDSVLAVTPEGVAVCISDPGADPAASDARALDRQIAWLPEADVVAAATPGDVVRVDPPCLIAAGWLERLRDAAYSDAVIATASALTSGALGLSPLPDPARFQALASRSAPPV